MTRSILPTLLLAFAVSACSVALRRDVAHAALDIAQVACIVAHAESSEPAIAAACSVADLLLPDLRKIVGAQRQASREFASRSGAPLCADGGAR